MEQNFKEVKQQLAIILSLLLGQKKALNLEQTATYTGFSKSHLYKLTSTGGIPCYKPQGKHIYFDKDELDNWLLQNKKATNEEIQAQAEDYLIQNRA